MLELNFSPFPELETERLLLRRMVKQDLPQIFFLRSDVMILEHIGKEPARTIKEAEEFFTRVDQEINSNKTILWGLSIKTEPDILIGTICYWNIQFADYRAEIGYILNPAFWRKGLMKEAIKKILEYGFSDMHLHSIEARINADNLASAAVLESTGFIKEGYLKEEIFYRGKFLDTIIYSRLQ